MKKKLNPVFVFNCHYNGLALIQSIGSQSIPVYALDTHRSVGAFSKYSKYIKVYDPLINEGKFIEELIRLAIKLKSKPLLLPTNDHWVEAISKNKEKLSKYCIVSAPDFKTTQLLLNKYEFANWCISRGILAPNVYDINKEEDIDKLLFPIAIKAKARRKSDNNDEGAEKAKIADKLRFNICNTKEKCVELFNLAKQYSIPLYAQDLVQGDSSAMRTIGVFAKNGIVKGIFYGKKVRGYPAQFGDCIVGQVESVPIWARELVVNVCKELNYTGIAEFELMEDEKTKTNYIIEINPRSWSWIGAAKPAGVDLAWLAYKNLVLNEDDLEVKETSAENPVIFSKVLDDFVNSLYLYKKEGAYKWAKNFKEWRNEYKNKNVVFAEFSNKDYPIALFSLMHFFIKILAIIKGKFRK